MHRSLATLAGAAALAVAVTVTASAQQKPAAPAPQQNPPVETGALDTTKAMTPPSATTDTGYTAAKDTSADSSKANKKKGKWETADTTKPKQD
jgi:hypothetical protein